jgi:hypothetical protein
MPRNLRQAFRMLNWKKLGEFFFRGQQKIKKAKLKVQQRKKVHDKRVLRLMFIGKVKKPRNKILPISQDPRCHDDPNWHTHS